MMRVLASWPFVVTALSFLAGAWAGHALAFRGKPTPRRGLLRSFDDNQFAIFGGLLGALLVVNVPQTAHVLFDPPPTDLAENEWLPAIGYVLTVVLFPAVMFTLLYWASSSAHLAPRRRDLAQTLLERIRASWKRVAVSAAMPALCLAGAWQFSIGTSTAASTRFFTIVCVLWIWGSVGAFGRLLDAQLRGTRLRLVAFAAVALLAWFAALGLQEHELRPLASDDESEVQGPSIVADAWLTALHRRLATIDPQTPPCNGLESAEVEATATPGDGQPLLFVAAAGGGSRAAIYASLVLSMLERTPSDLAELTGTRPAAHGYHGGRIYDRIVAMSGVSGGSVGIANFAANHDKEGTPPTRGCPMRNVFCSELQIPVMDRLRPVMMRPVVDHMLADFQAPFLIGALDPLRTRGEWMAKFWREHLGWSERLAARPAGSSPLLLLNAVDAREGHRVVFGVPSLPAELLAPSTTFLPFSAVSERYTVEDAVRTSASFPFGMDLPRRHSRPLIDGGVLDNSGTDTLAALLTGLDRPGGALSEPVRKRAACLLRVIRAHPVVVIEIDSGAKPTTLGDDSPSRTPFLLPADSLTAAMWRRERYAVGEARDAVSAWSVEAAAGGAEPTWITFPYAPEGFGAASEDDGVMTAWALGPADKASLFTSFRNVARSPEGGTIPYPGGPVKSPVPSLLALFVQPGPTKPEISAEADEALAVSDWERPGGRALAEARFGAARLAQLTALMVRDRPDDAPSLAAEAAGVGVPAVEGDVLSESAAGVPTALWLPIGVDAGPDLIAHSLEAPATVRRDALAAPRLARRTLAFTDASLTVPVGWLVPGTVVTLEPMATGTDASGTVVRATANVRVDRAPCLTGDRLELLACRGTVPAADGWPAALTAVGAPFAPSCVDAERPSPEWCERQAGKVQGPAVLLSLDEEERAREATLRDPLARLLGVDLEVRHVAAPTPGYVSLVVVGPDPAETPGKATPRAPTPARAPAAAVEPPTAATGTTALAAAAPEAPPLPPPVAPPTPVAERAVALRLTRVEVSELPSLEGGDLDLMVTLHPLPRGAPLTKDQARGGSPRRFAGEAYRRVDQGATDWPPLTIYRENLTTREQTLRLDLEDHDLRASDGQELSDVWVTLRLVDGTPTLDCVPLDTAFDVVTPRSASRCDVQTERSGFAFSYSLELY